MKMQNIKNILKNEYWTTCLSNLKYLFDESQLKYRLYEYNL